MTVLFVYESPSDENIAVRYTIVYSYANLTPTYRRSCADDLYR